MPTVINTNLASLFAQNSLSGAQNNLAQSVQRLSSGLRINSAKDDAAGLAISQNMQSQINGTNQSINNLADATNLLQTADSSLSTVQDMLLRMKQLAVQGYDGSLSNVQKATIVTQMQDLNNEINATAQRTAFNGINLLTSGSSVDQVNSDLKTGGTLVNTQVAVDATQYSLGYYSTSGAGTGGLADGAYTGSGAVASTFKINLDPALQNQTPGSYTLTSNGANLTLTGTINGLASSQTVVVGDVSGGNQGGPGVTNFKQNLNFSNFGINIDTFSTVSAGSTEEGQYIASSLVTKGLGNATGISTINVLGTTASITDVRLAGVAPGTYTMTYDNLGPINNLSLPQTQTGFASSGVTTAGTQVVALTGGTGAGAQAAISYDATGKVTSISMQTAGTGYKAGDVLSTAAVTAANTHTNDAVTFSALTAGQNLINGGLTLTAVSAMTGAQVATAFSGITDGESLSTTQARLVSNGLATSVATLSGAFTGASTGLVQGAAGTTVNFVSTTAGATAAQAFTGTGQTAPSVAAPAAVITLGNTAVNGTVGLSALSGIAINSLTSAQTGSNYLTMSGTVNGVLTKQSVALSANSANNTETVNFGQFGVSFDIRSNQTQTANQIGAALASMNSASATYGTTGNYIPGQVVVSQGANSNLQFQSGANSSAFIGINTLNIQTGVTGTTAGTAGAMMTLGTAVTGTNATGSAAGTLGSMTVNNTISDWQTAFQSAAAAVDKAVDYISTQRATYGSQMNRLSYISQNLQSQSTNLQASRSAITDTNFASETANLTKGQIMQQAATAMLAQANQMPNVILSLLK
jgi:flagellin